MYKVLLLGIGNELLGDDAVGIKIAKYFEGLDLHLFEIEYAGIGGFNLFDYIEGYKKVIIVDSFEKTYDRLEEYQVVVFEKNEIIEKSLIYSSHETSLGMGLRLAEITAPELIPEDIKFIAIEIPIQKNYSNRLTKHTKKLAVKAINEIILILESFQIKIYSKELNCRIFDEVIDIFE